MIVTNREQYLSADKSEPNELVKEVFSKVLPLISRFDLIELVVFFLSRIIFCLRLDNIRPDEDKVEKI